jgi:beta-glucanase (GH16 family)
LLLFINLEKLNSGYLAGNNQGYSLPLILEITTMIRIITVSAFCIMCFGVQAQGQDSDFELPTEAQSAASSASYPYLIWADEFNGDGSVNTNKWHHQTQLPNGNSWYNGELQHYTDRVENTYLEGGALHIKAIAESFTDQGQTKQYTSARLNSKFAFTYGRVEVRAKLPQGAGTWPAIWMLGKNIAEPGGYWYDAFGEVAWPACGEIDIMEHWGTNPNYVSSAIHTPSSFGGTVNVGGTNLSDVFNTYHTYEMEWSPEGIAFSIDGNPLYTYAPPQQNDATWPFDNEQYLLLNVAINGDITPAFSESEMVIDYVRVYGESPPASDYYLITQFLQQGVLLIWNPPVGTMGCEVHSGPQGGNDPYRATVVNADPHYHLAAPEVFSPAGDFQWRVRCTDPDGNFTPFSEYATFSYPSPWNLQQALPE